MEDPKKTGKYTEEEALVAGVAKYGVGKSKLLRHDPHFAPPLLDRSYLSLKDEWRTVYGTVDSKQKPSLHKNSAEGEPSGSDAPMHLNASVSSNPVRQNASRSKENWTKVVASRSESPIRDNASRSTESRAKAEGSASDNPIHLDSSSDIDDDVQHSARIDAMILEALMNITNKNGSDIGAITNFIEQKHKLPRTLNFQKALLTRLGILLSRGKLEKAQKTYRLGKQRPPRNVKKMPSRKPNAESNVQQKPPAPPLEDPEPVKAAEAAACLIAEAEEQSFLAAFAVDRAESEAKLSEEADAMLQLVTDIYKNV